MVRAFVAIDLPSEIRERMAECRNVLSQSDAQLTFVTPQNMHITLKFIGEISEQNVERVKSVLEKLPFKSFTMSVGGVGANSIKRPRVIWATAQDGGGSAGMHRMIDGALAPLGIEREDRYTPHATIARVRRFDPSLLAAIGKIASTEFGVFRVERCSLKKSTLTPKGPIYEDIMEVRF